jgi:hypothetical protein
MNTRLVHALVTLILAASCGGQLAPTGEVAATDGGAVGAGGSIGRFIVGWKLGQQQ